MAPPPPWRQRLRLYWYLVLAAWALFALWPTGTVMSRLYLIAGTIAAWALPLAIWWSRRRLRVGLLAIGAAALLLLVGPGRSHDVAALRQAYVRALDGYVGTPYRELGESRFGMDASGLVRKAMVVAAARQGLVTLNPRLLRAALAIWWFDTSSAALGQGYRGFTAERLVAPSVRALPPDQPLPGDLAIAVGASHALACGNDGSWIYADASAGRVVRRHADEPVGWFDAPVRLVRWRLLGD